MHEGARHAIHSTETLAVVIEMIAQMRKKLADFHEKNPPAGAMEEAAVEKTQSYMTFQLQMLKNLRLRSEANQERLRNEITLVTPSAQKGEQRKLTVVQAYNRITQQDSNSMKAIAVVTMAFLPATFTSVSSDPILAMPVCYSC